jgi:hypothetical protein
MFILISAYNEETDILSCSKDKAKLEALIETYHANALVYEKKNNELRNKNNKIIEDNKNKIKEFLIKNKDQVRNPNYLKDKEFFDRNGIGEWDDMNNFDLNRGNAMTQNQIDNIKNKVIEGLIYRWNNYGPIDKEYIQRNVEFRKKYPTEYPFNIENFKYEDLPVLTAIFPYGEFSELQKVSFNKNYLQIIEVEEI